MSNKGESEREEKQFSSIGELFCDETSNAERNIYTLYRVHCAI